MLKEFEKWEIDAFEGEKYWKLPFEEFFGIEAAISLLFLAVDIC